MRSPVTAIYSRLPHRNTSRSLRLLWFFIAMSIVGYAIQSMIYLPPFQSQAWRLAFLVLLRFVALVIPAYILLKGRGIGHAFNGSIATMFVLNTTWHVCYYIYL